MTREEALAIARVMRNNLAIAGEFAPEVFRGDVLFFSATEDAPASAEPADLSLATGKADSWRPYVGGVLTDHAVPCGHYEMTEPEPVARIGAVLAAALRPAAG